MIIIVADIKSSTLSRPYKQSLGIVLESFFSGILGYQSTAVVSVLTFTKLDNAIHIVVFHRDCVSSVRQR